MYRHHGVQRRLVLGTYPILSLADARKVARRTLRDVQLGQDPAALKREAAEQAPSAREARTRGAGAFEALTERFPGAARQGAQPDLARGEERTIQRELLPRWGNLAASEVTRRHVIELLEEVVDRGADIMANRVKALVSKIFNFALSEKDPVVALNPAYGVKNPTPERQRDRVF